MRIFILSLISIAVAVNDNLAMNLAREFAMEIATVSEPSGRDIASKYIGLAQDEISALMAMLDTFDMSEARAEGLNEIEEQLSSRQVFLRELVGSFDYKYEVFPAEPLKGLGRILWPLAELRPISADQLQHISNEFAEFVESQNVPQDIARHMAKVVHTHIYKVLDGPEFDDAGQRYGRIVNQVVELGQLIESIEAEYH